MKLCLDDFSGYQEYLMALQKVLFSMERKMSTQYLDDMDEFELKIK